MPRPKSRRLIDMPPLFSHFKPSGIRARDLDLLEMSLDELEALRLADLEGMNQDDAAAEMDISRSTFSRLVESARSKSARFLVDGGHLAISGGPVHFKDNRYRCLECGKIFRARFDESSISCIQCGSENVVDLADRFGHGDCCRTPESPTSAD